MQQISIPTKQELTALRKLAIEVYQEPIDDPSGDANWLRDKQGHVVRQLNGTAACASGKYAIVTYDCATSLRRRVQFERWLKSEALSFYTKDYAVKIRMNFLPRLNRKTNEFISGNVKGETTDTSIVNIESKPVSTANVGDMHNCIEPQMPPWSFLDILACLKQVHTETSKQNAILTQCHHLAEKNNFSIYEMMLILDELQSTLKGTGWNSYADMLRFTRHDCIPDPNNVAPEQPHVRPLPREQQLMQQFSQLFVASEVEETTLQDLFAMFKDFTGFDDLTLSAFVSKYKPQNYWTRRAKCFRIGDRKKKEQVVYMVQRRQEHYCPTLPICVSPEQL